MKNYLSVDLETTNLSVTNNTVWMAGFADTDGIQVVNDCNGLKKLPTARLKQLADSRTVKIIHRSEFDAPLIRHAFGVEVRNIWDTQVAENIIQGFVLPVSERSEELRAMYGTSLKAVLKRYGLKVPDKEIRENFIDRPKGKPFTKQEIKYQQDDVSQLYKLMCMQRERIEELGLTEVVELEMKVCEVVASMRYHGIGYNAATWDKDVESDTAKVQDMLAGISLRAYDIKGAPAVENWNSPAQVKKYFAYAGIEIESLTTMEHVARDFHTGTAIQVRGIKLLREFIAYRTLSQNVAKYNTDWKDRFLDADGRIRCTFDQMVNTSRFQLSKPNLSQLPGFSGRRGAFVPAPGNIFIVADYGGQEIGIMAAASREQTWIDAILRGEDIHSRSAALTFPADWQRGALDTCAYPFKCSCPVHERLRQSGKILNFMLAYGGGAPKYSADVGCSEMEARVIIRKFKNTIRHLNYWLTQNGKEGMATGVSYSASPYKRRRVLMSDLHWRLRNQGMNNPVQAAGADMLKRAMVNLHEALQQAGFGFIVLPWHDELIIEVPKQHYKTAITVMRDCMNEAADFVTGVEGLVKAEPEPKLNLLKKVTPEEKQRIKKYLSSKTTKKYA